MTHYPSFTIKTQEWKERKMFWFSITNSQLVWWDDWSGISNKLKEKKDEIEYIKWFIVKLEKEYDDIIEKTTSWSTMQEHWHLRKVICDDINSLKEKVNYLENTLYHSVL